DAIDADPASVRLHDTLRDGEPEAGAGDLAGGLVLDPIELVEHVRQVAGGDAHPSIGHSDPHRLGSIAVGRERSRDGYAAARGCVLDAVVDEVDQHLAD